MDDPVAGQAAVLSVRREHRLRVVLGLNLVLVVVQVVAGSVAHSVGLLSDAGHNLSDVAAVILSLVAVRLTRRPATATRSYGWHRSTVLAAQANAAALLVVTVLIMFEAIRRLANPRPVSGGIVVVVALVALAANGLSAVLLHEKSGDLNMRSALLHMAGDALASAGVAIAGGVILITGGNYWLDPVVSLGIAALIGVEAVRLLKATTEVLLESTPDGLDLNGLGAAITAVAGVEQVHDLHVWTLSTEVTALSGHLVMDGHPTLEEAQATATIVRDVLTHDFNIAHATLELECEPCAPHGHNPCGMDDVAVMTRQSHQH
jgi:cobalt-zinc-cadmium efflux system protein